MGRRRKVEGLVLDLTRMVEGVDIRLEDLIVHEERQVADDKHSELLGDTCGMCNCKKKCYRLVNDTIACYMCSVLIKASPEVESLVRDVYSRPCEFCGITGVVTQLDHVNMFKKRNTVLSMISQSIEEIKEEISKCQLLCVPCHNKVTAAERACGFMSKKTKLTRMIHAGRDVTSLSEIYSQKYDVVMSEVYTRLRQNKYVDN